MGIFSGQKTASDDGDGMQVTEEIGLLLPLDTGELTWLSSSVIRAFAY